MKKIEIIVSGRVQGVGFRYFVTNKARENNISGWVRNTRDGSVEICAEGEITNLDTFIDWIKQGPPLSRVDNVTIHRFDKPEGFTNFEIRF